MILVPLYRVLFVLSGYGPRGGDGLFRTLRLSRGREHLACHGFWTLVVERISDRPRRSPLPGLGSQLTPVNGRLGPKRSWRSISGRLFVSDTARAIVNEDYDSQPIPDLMPFLGNLAFLQAIVVPSDRARNVGGSGAWPTKLGTTLFSPAYGWP